MPVEFGVVLIGAGVAVAISLGAAVMFERWKSKQQNRCKRPVRALLQGNKKAPPEQGLLIQNLPLVNGSLSGRDTQVQDG